MKWLKRSGQIEQSERFKIKASVMAKTQNQKYNTENVLMAWVTLIVPRQQDKTICFISCLVRVSTQASAEMWM